MTALNAIYRTCGTRGPYGAPLHLLAGLKFEWIFGGGRQLCATNNETSSAVFLSFMNDALVAS